MQPKSLRPSSSCTAPPAYVLNEMRMLQQEHNNTLTKATRDANLDIKQKRKRTQNQRTQTLVKKTEN
jgi:hypothetical protein